MKQRPRIYYTESQKASMDQQSRHRVDASALFISALVHEPTSSWSQRYARTLMGFLGDSSATRAQLLGTLP